MDIRKGFYTVLKTNRNHDPSKSQCICICGKQTRMSAFFSMYTAMMNGIPNAAVILSYPKDGFGNPKALRVFLSTNAELSTQEILTPIRNGGRLNYFSGRAKVNLRWIVIKSDPVKQRYWLIMSLVHYLCCMHSGNYCTFEEGYASLKQTCTASSAPHSKKLLSLWDKFVQNHVM